MPVIHPADAAVYELPDVRFESYAHPSRGSRELCGWRVEVGPATVGTAHTVHGEELFLILSGAPVMELDGESLTLAAGDAVVVPAGSSLRLDNPGTEPVAGWVTTRVGLRATMADGSELAPPWANETAVAAS